MGDSANFSISSTGGVEDGFEIEPVQGEFATLFGIAPEKAAAYLKKQKLIRKNLSSAEAETYRERLQKIGLSVVVHQQVAGNDTPIIVNPVVADEDAFSLLPTGDEPDEPEAPAEAAKPRGFCCPKCDLEQERSKECIGCGIIFEKYNAASSAQQSAAATQDQGKSRARAIAKARAKSNDSEGENPLTFIVPIVVMIAGAFLWKTIALSFDRELAVVAWGIGGAIGAAAVFTGARGSAAAAACALLVVASIFGGKYMYMSSFQQELAEMLTSEEVSEEVAGYYDTINTEAAEFALIDKDDVSVKQFMFEYDYTGARSAAFISEEELDEFRQYVQPMLEHSVEQAFTTDQALIEVVPELGAAVEESVWPWVFASIGLLDLLFLFFGCGTAYRMVSEAE